MKEEEEEKKDIDKELEKKSKILTGALGTATGMAYLGKYGWKKVSPITALHGTPHQAELYKSLGKTANGLAIATAAAGGYSAYKHYKNRKKK